MAAMECITTHTELRVYTEFHDAHVHLYTFS